MRANQRIQASSLFVKEVVLERAMRRFVGVVVWGDARDFGCANMPLGARGHVRSRELRLESVLTEDLELALGNVVHLGEHAIGARQAHPPYDGRHSHLHLIATGDDGVLVLPHAANDVWIACEAAPHAQDGVEGAVESEALISDAELRGEFTNPTWLQHGPGVFRALQQRLRVRLRLARAQHRTERLEVRGHAAPFSPERHKQPARKTHRKATNEVSERFMREHTHH